MSHNSVIGKSDVLEVPRISFRSREAGNLRIPKGRFSFSHDAIMLWPVRHLDRTSCGVLFPAEPPVRGRFCFLTLSYNEITFLMQDDKR
jgi:hypothetical protein